MELAVEPIRAGNTHATATGRLLQDGKEILRTLATFSDLGAADAGDLVSQHGLAVPR